MKNLNFPTSSNLLHGFENSDDAGIYKINDNQAIVQTLDFITPVVNDPYIYGQIAAANSLSDVYAMGGKVLTAMNVVAYDSCNVTPEMLKEMLAGALSKVVESEAVVVGGHTIEDLEMKFGLSVTGIVHPKKYLKNNGIKNGDKIILTKPIGLGVLTTGIKGGLASEKNAREAAFHMAQLNKIGSEIAIKYGVNGLTDVTGFGFLGHLREMLADSLSIDIYSDKVPIIEGAKDLANLGIFPSGSYRNRSYVENFVTLKNVNEDDMMLFYDAQTSGGLLISLPEENAISCVKELKDNGYESAEIVGEVKTGEKRIFVK